MAVIFFISHIFDRFIPAGFVCKLYRVSLYFLKFKFFTTSTHFILSKFLMKNNNKCRDNVATGLLWGYPIQVVGKSPKYPCSNIFPALIIVLH